MNRLDSKMGRRDFLQVAAGIAVAMTACSEATDPFAKEPSRLDLTPRQRTSDTSTGVDVLTDQYLRRAYISVPPTYDPSKPAPLIIALHGAVGRGDDFIPAYSGLTDAAGMVLLAPNSFGVSWDAIEGQGTFGNDVVFINQMVAKVFERCAIDHRRIALLGFSDGATYALSLGLANGDEVRQIVAHSPGYVINGPRHGKPAAFISHGTADQVLPIDATSRKIVPALRAAGEVVTYVEFDGGHEVPEDVALEAIQWLQQ